MKKEIDNEDTDLDKTKFFYKTPEESKFEEIFCVYDMGTLLDQKHIFYYQAKNCINASLYEKMKQAKGGFIFMRPFSFRIVFTSKGVRVGVVIRRVELYDLVKTAFSFRIIRLRRLRSSEN